MISTNNKIIVRCNIEQKSHMIIGGKVMQVGNAFEVNYREKSPVVAEVVSGNQFLKEGDFITAHHNLFYSPSPYFLYDDLFSIPATKVIFAVVNPSSGSLSPVYGNILGTRVEIESAIPLPPEQIKTHINRVIVIDGGWTKLKRGQLVFHTPNAAYDIVYNWGGEYRRVTKVHNDFVVGKI